MLRRALLRALARACALALALVATTGAVADAATWSNEAAMACDTTPSFRATFVFDPGVCNFTAPERFAQDLAPYYEARGFDRNFLVWAPTATIDATGREWASCQTSVAHPGALCLAPIEFHPISVALADQHINARTWGGAFIARACGNYSEGGGAGPVPVISGTKYEDLDADSQRDPGEPGLSGWTIQLVYDGNVVASTTTGAGGGYSFALNANTLPISFGSFEVREVQQSGWHAGETPGSVSVPVGAGDAQYGGRDFGNWRPVSISGRKFDDHGVDGSGSGDPGIAGWGIGLTGDATTSANTTGDGTYRFDGLRPGTYTVSEEHRDGWRQTAPSGQTHTVTLTSGQAATDRDFGNVCLGSAQVTLRDQDSGATIGGVEVRLEEISVPGILANDPPLPRTNTTGAFGGLLPGTYRVTAFLPDGVFSADPDTRVVDGRWATVKTITIEECAEAALTIDWFRASRGKVTGGMKMPVADGFATAGFQFQTRRDGTPTGTLEYQDHAAGLNLHTDVIEGIRVSDDHTEAWIWGRIGDERFRLHLVDLGEPGTSDRFELDVLDRYSAGAVITGGNVQIHK